MFDNPLSTIKKKKSKKFNLKNINVIAEGAQGYEGNISLAKLLIRSAALAEANMIKFQLVYADEILRRDHHHYKIFKSLEMNLDNWIKIKKECDKYKINLCLDIFGSKSLQVAKKLNIKYVKIHSSDFFNYELIEKSIKTFDFIFISIGGASENEINEIITRYSRYKNKLIFLYGFQSEPTSVSKSNAYKIFNLKSLYPDFNFGFMDHLSNSLNESLWLSSLCVANGIKIFEKHITLDTILEIEDFVSALPPNKFKQYVKNINLAQKFLGNKSIILSRDEIEYRNKAFKIVVANKNLKKNSLITKNDIKLLRLPITYKGDRLFRKSEAINKKILKDIKINEPITLKTIK